MTQRFGLPEKVKSVLRKAAASERKYWEGQQKTADNKKFSEWLDQALAGGAGAAHRASKACRPPPPDPHSVSKSLQEERKAWSNIWTRDQADLQATRQRLDKVRRDMWSLEGQDQAELQVTVPKLKKVVAATKAYAGKGPDSIGKHLAQKLP